MKYIAIILCLMFIGCVGLNMEKKKTSNQRPTNNEQQPTNTQRPSGGQDSQSDGGTFLPGESSFYRWDSSNGTDSTIWEDRSWSDNNRDGDGDLFQDDTGVSAQPQINMDRVSVLSRCRLFLGKEEVFKYFVRGGILLVSLILIIGWVKEKRKRC